MAPRKEKPTSFILRDVEGGMWQAFKARAESEGRSMKWIILQLIAYYIEHGMPREVTK